MTAQPRKFPGSGEWGVGNGEGIGEIENQEWVGDQGGMVGQEWVDRGGMVGQEWVGDWGNWESGMGRMEG